MTFDVNPVVKDLVAKARRYYDGNGDISFSVMPHFDVTEPHSDISEKRCTVYIGEDQTEASIVEMAEAYFNVLLFCQSSPPRKGPVRRPNFNDDFCHGVLHDLINSGRHVQLPD
jgi:hypothetical protein